MQPLEVNNYADLEKLILSSDNMGFALPTQQSMIISCPKKMVGRVIGKNGETIKALQQFTGAQIQIDQRSDPTRVSIAGAPKAMQMATSMVQDIVAGTFKGFAMLRSYATQATKAPGALEPLGQPAPVYIEGYGFIPPSQFSDVSEGPFGYPQLQPYMNNQVPNQASLSALSQLYSLQNHPEYNMGIANVPHAFNGMNGLEQNQQQAHMASLARSLLDSQDLKPLPNGAHHSHMPASQPDIPPDIYSSMGLTSSSWSQPQTLLPLEEAAAKIPTPGGSMEHSSPSRERSHSSTTADGRGGGTPQDPSSLAAQLQALSLLSNYQDHHRRPPGTADTAQHPPSSTGIPQRGDDNQPPPPKPALPHGWMHITDPEKRELYYNYLTGHTQYTLPTETTPLSAGKPVGSVAPDGEAAGISSPPGQRVAAPPRLHSNDSIGSLGPRLSVPTTAAAAPAPTGRFFPGGLASHSGPADPRMSAPEGQATQLDAALSSLGQRLPDSNVFKLGTALPPNGLFQ